MSRLPIPLICDDRSGRCLQAPMLHQMQRFGNRHLSQGGMHYREACGSTRADLSWTRRNLLEGMQELHDCVPVTKAVV